MKSFTELLFKNNTVIKTTLIQYLFFVSLVLQTIEKSF